MKKFLALIAVSTLMTGCIITHEREMSRKEFLCEQFGMQAQVFQFPDMKESDVICRDPETGQQVYMMLIPEKKVYRAN